MSLKVKGICHMSLIFSKVASFLDGLVGHSGYYIYTIYIHYHYKYFMFNDRSMEFHIHLYCVFEFYF